MWSLLSKYVDIKKALLIAEWGMVVGDGAEEIENLAAEKVTKRLQKDYPNATGSFRQVPVGWVARGRPGSEAQLFPKNFRLAHTFHGNHTRDWDLAMDHVSKKWPSIMEPLFEIGMNSMAVVVDLRASTEGLALNETDVIAGMLQSHLRSDLADCELRLAYAKEQRFYANITFSSYRDLHLTGQGGSITSSSISDHGFAIKIDVNTKLASLSNLAELQRFGPKDFDALLSLCHEVFRARIPEILGGD